MASSRTGMEVITIKLENCFFIHVNLNFLYIYLPYVRTDFNSSQFVSMGKSLGKVTRKAIMFIFIFIITMLMWMIICKHTIQSITVSTQFKHCKHCKSRNGNSSDNIWFCLFRQRRDCEEDWGLCYIHKGLKGRFAVNSEHWQSGHNQIQWHLMKPFGECDPSVWKTVIWFNSAITTQLKYLIGSILSVLMQNQSFGERGLRLRQVSFITRKGSFPLVSHGLLGIIKTVLDCVSPVVS